MVVSEVGNAVEPCAQSKRSYNSTCAAEVMRVSDICPKMHISVAVTVTIRGQGRQLSHSSTHQVWLPPFAATLGSSFGITQAGD